MNIKQKATGNYNVQQVIHNFFLNINNVSSIIADALPEIAKIVENEVDITNDTIPYHIEDKITYNNLKIFTEIIKEYGTYGEKIDELYDEYDNSSPGFKKKILKYFKTKYILEKQNILMKNKNYEPLEIVKQNSDRIMQNIFEIFINELKKSNNLKIDMEQIDACALAVICHAFISCRILEKPSNDN